MTKAEHSKSPIFQTNTNHPRPPGAHIDHPYTLTQNKYSWGHTHTKHRLSGPTHFQNQSHVFIDKPPFFKTKYHFENKIPVSKQNTPTHAFS